MHLARMRPQIRAAYSDDLGLQHTDISSATSQVIFHYIAAISLHIGFCAAADAKACIRRSQDQPMCPPQNLVGFNDEALAGKDELQQALL